MGPVVDEALTTFLFRPFQSSTTFTNLKTTRCGVFHITDDVDMLVQAALGEWEVHPALLPAKQISGQIIASACRAYEFEVLTIDDSRDRAEIRTRLLHVTRLRDFWGWNRARHAVLELIILVTRLHLTPLEILQAQLAECEVIVDKTAGGAERTALERIKTHLQRQGIAFS